MRIDDPGEVERVSLELLEDLMHRLKGAPCVVIGGWCLTAYAGNVRYTKDIDLMCARGGVSRLTEAFDPKEFNVKSSGFGLRAKHNATGIEVHVTTGENALNGSTNTTVKVPSSVFSEPALGRVTGLFYKEKQVDIPVCGLEFFVVLKALPAMAKHDFDFIILLTSPLALKGEPVQFDAKKFAGLLKSNASDLKAFREKEKRIRNKQSFDAIGNAVAPKVLTRARRERVLACLDEIDGWLG